MATASTALATHDLWLQTPATCVEDRARGQTEKGPGEGGYHKFHENVHLGTPGTFALAQGGQVTVGKGTCP